MKKTYKNLAIILVAIVVTLVALSACDLTGVSDKLKTDIEKCEITFSQTEYKYTGEAIKPEITVKLGNKLLEQDTHYSVRYFDNIDIGKGKIEVTGKGNFDGQVIKEFDIVENDENYINYTFSADDAQLISGQLNQKVKSAEDIKIPTVSKVGYEFLHWTCEGKKVDFENKESLPQQDSTFVAVFKIITYTVEYKLNGGENSAQNKSEFTVENIFELQDAVKSNKKFAGWYLDENFDERINSLSGFSRNLVLYAKYVDFDYRKVTYIAPDDVESITYDMVFPNTTLKRPDEVVSDDGSKRLVWYLDEGMTIRHNLHIMPDEDLTLYARWEDNLYAGFLDRGWYKISDIKSIDSYEDMLAFIEFIYYFNITEESEKPITYVSGENNVKAEILKAARECTFPRMLGFTYRYSSSKVAIYMSAKIDSQATLSATDREDYYPQLGYVFDNYVSDRDSNFDDFAINYVNRTYECETSDQLFYVLSHGYRPVPVSGSTAHRIYNKFKEIMRSICDDRMTDLQKARAIFDWLVINVYYDNNVANTQLPYNAYRYNAFFLEGVLNGAAVCDGISKAYSVMCAIEGIDCVRVTGELKDNGSSNNNDAGHAWNKIQIMGKWYLTDATWGNRVFAYNNGADNEYYEYVNGQYFLFTDNQRANVDNYEFYQYSYYVADSEYNHFSNFKMKLEFKKTNILGTTTIIREFDLYLDGDEAQDMSIVEEMSYIFEYIDKNISDLDGVSFCIKLGEDMSTNRIVEARDEYINRVKYDNARIKKFILIGDENDYLDSEKKIYRAGSILTIILSLPQSTYQVIQNAA